MATALIIPGVQVKTEFEPSPALFGPTGILGVIGVAIRGPVLPTPVGNAGEFFDIFGPGSRYTMPEVIGAFANGVSRAVIARIEPGHGQKATLDLFDDDNEKVVTLEARAEGAWGNKIAVKVTQVKALTGKGVKYINFETFLDGRSLETFNGLVMDEESPDYLFDRINQQSKVFVAFDPLFQKALPQAIGKTPLSDADERVASATLKAGATDVVRVEAKQAGKSGNLSAVVVSEGQAGMELTGAGNAPSVEISARQPGTDGTNIRISVAAAGPDSFNVVITPAVGALRTLGPFTSTDALVAATKNDPDVVVTPRGAALPSAQAATRLPRRVTIEVITEGRDTATYPNLATLDAIEDISDPIVKFSVIGAATQLPNANTGLNLKAGRNKGPAIALTDGVSTDPLLEIVPAPGVTAKLEISLTRGISSVDRSTGVVNLSVFQDDELSETFNNLTLDPDDPNFSRTPWKVRRSFAPTTCSSEAVQRPCRNTWPGQKTSATEPLHSLKITSRRWIASNRPKKSTW